VISTSSQGPRVVHSSFGRLRVHLPDPDGRVSAHLRRLPGVFSAVASELTGNLLILYHPRQINEKALLGELQPFCAESAPAALPPAPRAAAVSVPRESDHRDNGAVVGSPADVVTGPLAGVYKALGWSSVGLAVVGAITPGIPTVPFLVVAAYFFIRSSPAAHEWLIHSRWFGPMLREWEEQRGVRRSVKYSAVGLIALGLVFTWLIGLPTAVMASIMALEAIGLVLVLRLPVIEPAPATA
jgi:uncharacterized membrane protein YbaN (DUF454 family)